MKIDNIKGIQWLITLNISTKIFQNQRVIGNISSSNKTAQRSENIYLKDRANEMSKMVIIRKRGTSNPSLQLRKIKITPGFFYDYTTNKGGNESPE